MELKDRLEAARAYAGLTQPATAARVNMSQANYHKLESGKNQNSAKLLELALLFKVNPEWLATGRGEMVTAATDTDKREIIQLNAQKWAVLSLAVDRLTADIKHNTYNDTPETLEEMKAAALELKQLLNDCQRRNGYTI